MSTSQPELFPDDERPASVPALGVAGSAKVLTPAQRRFNKLLGEIERAKTELAQWQAAATDAAALAATALAPRQAALHSLQRRMVARLDELLASAATAPKLTRRRREVARDVLVELADELLAQGHDDELVALHDRHADLTRAEQDRLEAEMAREMFGQMLGDDALPDHAEASLDDVLRAGHARLNEHAAAQQREQERKAHKRAERRRAQGKGPTQQEKLAHARQQAGQSLREVYRKLASALHPDRATEPADRERRTALMQRANRAYDAQDLLALLSLQVEAEQIDANHLAGLADERVQHYNLVLQEQLDALRGEIAESAQALGITRVGAGGPRDAVQRSLQAELAGIEAACRQIETDLALLQDPKRRLAVIDGWLADQRDDAAFSDADIEMFGALMGIDAPPRRGRRRR